MAYAMIVNKIEDDFSKKICVNVLNQLIGYKYNPFFKENTARILAIYYDIYFHIF